MENGKRKAIKVPALPLSDRKYREVSPRGSGRFPRVSGINSVSRIIRSKTLNAAQSYDDGVMIIPPAPGLMPLIDQDMKRIRMDIINEIGQEAYEKRIKEANDEFEQLTGKKVRS
ncbi:hypothetical protein [Fontibacillus sp. BL9]|uniref:hypothetical protein n=1 Tax=Fontibacillus sp. BL9 TaxID=3389971 RepID=UPI00397D0F78